MNQIHVSPTLTVAAQIASEDLPTILGCGFKTLICCRPDNESGGEHVSSAQIRDFLGSEPLRFEYFPVDPRAITEAVTRDFQSLVDRSPKPVLAYCASGKRVLKMVEVARHQESAE